MARTDAQQTYARLMKETWAPALRTAGLRGSSGRFELPSPERWLLLGFQKATSSVTASVKFTLNLSAIDRTWWFEQRLDRTYLPEHPAPNTVYGTGAEQTRIGFLLPDPRDVWWTLTRDDGVVAAEVGQVLAGVAVPWLVARA